MTRPSSSLIDPDAAQVLAFWFTELRREQWFARDATVDAAIRKRFADLYRRLAAEVPATWRTTPAGHLAAVIVLDQFPRHLFRGDPRAFASDDAALALAEEALAAGVDRALGAAERIFLCMPFQHSESREIQACSVALFAAIGDPEALEAAKRHREIVDRFGRFSHRNAALGRASTPEEIEFLKEPKSSF